MNQTSNCLSLEITGEILENSILEADTIPEGSMFLNFSGIHASSVIPECFLILMDVCREALVYLLKSEVCGALCTGLLDEQLENSILVHLAFGY